MTPSLKTKRLHPNAKLPTRASPGSAGLDLYAVEDVWLPGHRSKMVATGIAIELPTGHEGQIRPRSGLASKHQITVCNSPGTIDSDFRAEIKVILINHSDEQYQIHAGDRIAQLVIAPVTMADVIEVDALSDTERGQGGFGSSGR